MAVEARHLNLFSPQLLGNRQIMSPIEANMTTTLYNNNNTHSSAFNNSSLLPLSGITTATGDAPTLLPTAPYNSLIVDSVPNKTTTAAIKSDSGLTYNLPVVSRKRSRDSINYHPLPSYKNTNPNSAAAAFSFLGEDISLQIQQQQLDLDNLIAQHMENVRMELEEKRKRQARRIMEAIEVGMMKRLKAKEEEIAKIGKLNWALEEKVKSLCMENQIWRDLAQTNEATANALRSNLEQVLAHQVKDDRRIINDGDDDDAAVFAGGATALMDDAESCCGSSGGGDEEEGNDDEKDSDGWRRIGGGSAKDKEEEEGKRNRNGIDGNSRLCRNCGKGESCVLILPCRHLCLCTVCGSSLHTCPICKSFKTASVHVNMS